MEAVAVFVLIGLSIALGWCEHEWTEILRWRRTQRKERD
jgi:hypothetical protein